MSLVKKKLISIYFIIGCIFGSVLNVYAKDVEGAEKIDELTDMISGIFQKIGGVIIFIGAVQVAWSIASDNPESKNQGLKVVASGVLVLAISSGYKAFIN